jgi:hypothetical protein
MEGGSTAHVKEKIHTKIRDYCEGTGVEEG